MSEKVLLGIDVGSISTNAVVMSREGKMLRELYIRSEGDPIRSMQAAMRDLNSSLPSSSEVTGVCVTGSGRNLIGALIGADIVKNEIMAHAIASIHSMPTVQTVFEIGGQDSKVTIIRDGVVVDFAMNLVCAAGTGSFLDSQAKRLGIPIQEVGDRAVRSEKPTDIAGRCTVFAESDMIHKQQIGYAQDDILMGLCHALVRNYLSNVCRGKELTPPFMLQGGISANLGIRRAFSEALGAEIHVPEHNMVMGAYGAALIAGNNGNGKTSFRGFEIGDHEIRTSTFSCSDCANRCEIIQMVDSGTVVAGSGGRCGKWEKGYTGSDADER
jgi:predicted CoA-substrate-specific enzyme activase